MNYLGPIDQINFKVFEGPNIEANFGVSGILDVGISASYAFDLSGNSNGVVGRGFNIGFGFSPLFYGGSFTAGGTFMYKP